MKPKTSRLKIFVKFRMLFSDSLIKALYNKERLFALSHESFRVFEKSCWNNYKEHAKISNNFNKESCTSWLVILRDLLATAIVNVIELSSFNQSDHLLAKKQYRLQTVIRNRWFSDTLGKPASRSFSACRRCLCQSSLRDSAGIQSTKSYQFH